MTTIVFLNLYKLKQRVGLVFTCATNVRPLIIQTDNGIVLISKQGVQINLTTKIMKKKFRNLP